MGVTFLQGTSDTTDTATYTFAGQNLGTASSDRIIIVAACARGTGTFNPTSVTIAGVDAVCVAHSGVSSQSCSIHAALVPTGTSGDIVVSYGSTALRCRIAVWAGTSCSYLPTDSSFASATDPSTTIDIPAGGFAVAAAVVQAGADACAWTGLTERDDAAIEAAITFSASSDDFGSTQTGLSVQANWTSTNASQLVVGAWGPAPSGSGGGLMRHPGMAGGMNG